MSKLTIEQQAEKYQQLVANRREWGKNYRKAHPDKVREWSRNYRIRTQELVKKARAAGLDK